MIDEVFLIKAAQIRRDYKNLNKDIENIEYTVKNFLPLLEDHQGELQEIQKQVNNGRLNDKEIFTNKLLKIIMNLETETSNYELMVDQIHNKMDVLRDDEEDLFNKIKSQYPDLPLSVIKEEVNKYLKSQNLL
jgi:chromosome segregation ATPase